LIDNTFEPFGLNVFSTISYIGEFSIPIGSCNLLFAGTIVGIFIIIYQASQSILEIVTLKERCFDTFTYINIFMGIGILMGAL